MTDKEVEDFILKHADVPKKVYDPVKAHEYYMRTRKLKGRRQLRFGTPTKKVGGAVGKKTTGPTRKINPEAYNLKGYNYDKGKWYDPQGNYIGDAKYEDSTIVLAPGAKPPPRTAPMPNKKGGGTRKAKVKRIEGRIAELQKALEQAKSLNGR